VPGALGPAHRFRKIKGAPVISPAFSRGHLNNGYIDVALEASDDESGWKNVETYGRTVRLPEKGIKLDFLSRYGAQPALCLPPVYVLTHLRRSRENRKGKPIPPLGAASILAATPAVHHALDAHTLEEQQAAHNLAQLSGFGDTGITKLVDTLLVGPPFHYWPQSRQITDALICRPKLILP